MEKIGNIELKNSFENLLLNSNQNHSSENSDFFKRAFFILNIPIEAFDLMNIPDEIRETIELIDFPGLDSINNFFKSEVLKHLLQFSDGFIFVNKGNSIMESEKVKNLNKIIQLIIENKKYEFTFKSCLFILNRCDEVEIDIEESKKEYEKIFEINSREKTFNEIIAISKKLKDLNNINITKFSNKLYSEFKNFMNRVNNFYNYMKEYEIKNDKKYVGKKYLMFLKKKVYEDVCLISSEKYKSFKKKQIDIAKYQEYFKLFLKEEENKSIIYDIIKMYLFIKDSFYESKFYEKSNAKDFFEKFRNQILVSKLFSEDSLKNIVKNYIFETKITFEIINIKININKIGLKFSKDDFTNAYNNINKKFEKNKIIFEKEIDSKYQLMEEEHDKLIKDFKDGKNKSYEKSLENTGNKINIIKKDLNNNLNQNFKNFTQEIIKELNFIVEGLKELTIQEEKINNNNIFKNVNEAEKTTFLIGGAILSSPITLPIFLIATEAGAPFGLALAGVEIWAAYTFLTPLMAATGGAIGIGVAGLVHLGFSLYKKYKEKGKYIKLIEDSKKELKASYSELKTNVSENLKKIKNQIESALKKFEDIYFSKNKGIMSHKEEWLTIFNKFIKLASDLQLLNN